jgi:FkbM family methyltransferase
LKKGSAKEVFQIIKNVQTRHLLVALAARVDNRVSHVSLKHDAEPVEINHYIEFLKYRGNHILDDIYEWQIEGEKLFGNYRQMIGMENEYLTGIFKEIYQYQWKGKTILDIGGFVGDTALYFLKNGAKNVIVYEPLKKNIQALHLNLSAYQGKFEAHQKALAKHNGVFIISSNEPEGGLGFGSSEGSYKIHCEGIKIQDMLRKHPGVDAIKVDCEGAEIHLLELTKSQLQAIPYWIVETHSTDLYNKILRHFHDCGFKKTFDRHLSDTVSLLHFEIV